MLRLFLATLLLCSFYSGVHFSVAHAADAASTADKADTTTRFSAAERALINRHYKQLKQDADLYAQYHDPREKKAKSLPPGLQKKAAQGNLPPGWQKKLKIGAVLPPDVLAAADSLPAVLVAELPAGPAGTLTLYVDGHIIRVLEATRTLIDFFALPH